MCLNIKRKFLKNGVKVHRQTPTECNKNLRHTYTWNLHKGNVVLVRDLYAPNLQFRKTFSAVVPIIVKTTVYLVFYQVRRIRETIKAMNDLMKF